MQHQKKLDISIVIVTTFLIIFGLLMVYSASNVVATYKYNDSFYFYLNIYEHFFNVIKGNFLFGLGETVFFENNCCKWWNCYID